MIEEKTENLLAHDFQPRAAPPVEAASLEGAAMNNVVALDAVRGKYDAVRKISALMGFDPDRFSSKQEHWDFVLGYARDRANGFHRSEMLIYVAKHFAPNEETKQTVLAEAMEATKEIPQQEPLNAYYRQAMMRADIFLESGKREHIGAAIKAAQQLPDPHVYNPEIHQPAEYASQASGYYLVIDRLIERLNKLGGIE